jgi:hypothetical protein
VRPGRPIRFKRCSLDPPYDHSSYIPGVSPRLKIYHAALDDIDTPAVDIAFLRSIYETERQDDFDRANPVAYATYTGSPYQEHEDQDEEQDRFTFLMSLQCSNNATNTSHM